MKKRILSLALVVVMVALAAVGSLAYFTDKDSKTNTMTFGSVDISVSEMAYQNGKFVSISNPNEAGKLYPIANNKGVNLFNKWVSTTVASTSDSAYIRTIVLIEKNDNLAIDYVNEGGANCCFPGIHFAADGITNGATHKVSGVTYHTCKEGGHLTEAVNVDGNEYWVVWFVDAEETAIPANEALSSLLGVHMDKNITQEQADGWGEDGVQVLVLSQAIQADGLSHAEAMTALGEVTAANLAAWIE